MECAASFLAEMSRGGTRRYFFVTRIFLFGLDLATYTLYTETGSGTKYGKALSRTR